jgi:hypothetical protein
MLDTHCESESTAQIGSPSEWQATAASPPSARPATKPFRLPADVLHFLLHAVAELRPQDCELLDGIFGADRRLRVVERTVRCSDKRTAVLASLARSAEPQQISLS